MALALYRRYRPDTFDKVIGQDQVTIPLSHALDRGRLTHAYLFSGPRGCGKTSSARILARCINCVKGPTSHPCGVCESCKDLANGGPGSIDVVEIDAASHNGVEDARELRERATFAPARDRYKIFILDEAHMVTQQGFNALLKIVEEPPEHVMFIFATTEPDKVIGTIRSRTHHYPFRLVPQEIMGPYLEEICAKEQVGCEPGVLKLAMRAGGGSVRDTLSILDQLMVGSVDGVVSHDVAVSLLGFTPDALIAQAIDAIVQRDGERLYDVVQKVIVGGFDPRRFVEDLLARVRDLLVLTIGGERAESVLSDDAAAEDLQQLHTQASVLGLRQLSVIAETLNTALAGMNGAVSPRMRLELLAARLLAERDPESGSVSGTQAGSMPQSGGASGAAAGRRDDHGDRPGGTRPNVSRQATPAMGRIGFAGATHDGPARQAGPAHPVARQTTAVSPQTTHNDVAHNDVAHADAAHAEVIAGEQAVREGDQSDSRSVEERWDAVLGRLTQDVRAYVGHDRVTAVSLTRNAAGKQHLAMTFDRALSQHAFALALSSDAAANGMKASVAVLREVREVFGEHTMIVPTKIAASGEHVEPTSHMAPEQLAQIKRQIALDKAGLAAANLPITGLQNGNAQEQGRSGQSARKPSGEDHRDGSGKKQRGDPDTSDGSDPHSLARSDGPTPDAHDATNGDGGAADDHAPDPDDDPWLQPVGGAPVAGGAAQPIRERDRATAGAVASKPHKVVAVPDMSDDDDPWAIPTGPRPAAPLHVRDDTPGAVRARDLRRPTDDGRQPGAQRLGAQQPSPQQPGAQRLGTRQSATRQPGSSMNPENAVTATSGDTMTAGDAAASGNGITTGNAVTTANGMASATTVASKGTVAAGGMAAASGAVRRPAEAPQVAAEDDEYSLDDRSLESRTTMDMAELEKVFAVKKVEEFAADDPRNPKNAQPANRHQEDR